ncbi:MAG: response regulator [Bacteroidales bacterium]|nr:response regulator [Bacteroidales bacterium]
MLYSRKQCSRIQHQNKQKTSLFETKNLQNGIIDSRGIIWVTHWESGLEGYNPLTKKHYQIDVDKEDKSLNVVFTLLEDADGSLWLGTFGAGLQHVENPDSDKPTITKYVFNKNENSLSNNFITSMFNEGKNALWLGTNGGGLNRFDKKRKTFEHFTTDNGLRSNVVQAIVMDLDSNIWFSSNVISKLDTKEKTITHYDASDGVYSRYFTCHAQSNPDGTLYFGDDKGILTFNPKYIDNNKIAPIPELSAIRLFGKEINPREMHKDIVPFNKSITFSDTIELPFYLNSLSLEFASILQPNSKSVSYSFMMEGIDEQWIYTKYSERQAIYVSLPHGKYTFVVRASLGNNIWSKPRMLHIIISPPWWKMLWFRLTFVLFFTIAIASLIYFYTKNLKQRNIRLEQLVARRTDELQKNNTTLQEERIVVEMKNKQLNDVLQSKEKLINIIAHDFKGPLNGIFGFAQLIQNEKNKKRYDKIDELIDIISNSAKSLVGQMVALLDWTKSEDKNLQANPIEIHTKILVEDAISLVKTIADQKNISIELHNDCVFNSVVDPLMGSMVFRNILSNAIKYTHQGGTVTILIQESTEGVAISFVDNGIGMTKEKIDSLFSTDELQESTPGTDNETGTGFGLRMSKIFLDKNNGKLSITSAERQGTVVTITLPKGSKNILEEATSNTTEQNTTLAEQTVSRSKNIVLVVDDDKEVINIIKKTLEEYCDVIEAPNGKEGISIAMQVLPDVIISDIQMPGTTGIELCEYLKKNKKTAHIPLLMVSSFNDEETKNNAFSVGANDYIEKPFNAFQLLKKVEALLVLKQKISEKTRTDVAIELYPDMPDEYDNKLIQKVNAFVDSHINIEKLNVNFIAQELNISRTQLWRLYKSRTGETLGDYIKERKLQKAYALLLTQKYRISDIA